MRPLFCSSVPSVVLKWVFIPNPMIHFQFSTVIHICRCHRMVVAVALAIGSELINMRCKAESIIYKFGFSKYLKFHFASDPMFWLLGTLRSVQNWVRQHPQLPVTVTPEPLVGWGRIHAFWKGHKILYHSHIMYSSWFCTVSNQRGFVRLSSVRIRIYI
jgi:hypothetical protein